MLEDGHGGKFSEAGVHLRTAAGIFERLYKVYTDRARSYPALEDVMQILRVDSIYTATLLRSGPSRDRFGGTRFRKRQESWFQME